MNYRRRGMWFRHEANFSDPEVKKRWQCGDIVAKYASFVESSNAQQVQRRLNMDWSTFFRLRRLQAAGKLPPHMQGRIRPAGRKSA